MTEERGKLTIDPTVVRKVAQHAADRVPGVVADPGAGARRARGSTARVGGEADTVDVALDLAVRYPTPIRSVVAAVRGAVTEDVEHITSYRVRGVEVTVSALPGDHHPRVR